jgi:hypothetical protein
MSDRDAVSDELQTNTDGFEFAKTEASAIVSGLTREQFNWRAEEGSWSVGECIDHLYQTGFHLAPAMRTEIDAARDAGKTGSGPFKYSWLGTTFAKTAGVPKDPNKGKVKAPKLYVPGSDLDPEELLPKFVALQDELIDVTRAADGLDLKKIKVPSPAPQDFAAEPRGLAGNAAESSETPFFTGAPCTRGDAEVEQL